MAEALRLIWGTLVEGGIWLEELAGYRKSDPAQLGHQPDCFYGRKHG